MVLYCSGVHGHVKFIIASGTSYLLCVLHYLSISEISFEDTHSSLPCIKSLENGR